MTPKSTWTGCYEVLITERAQNSSADAYGAFVNVVAVAGSAARFREMAAEALEEDGYVVLDVDDIQPFDLQNSDLPEEERALIAEGLSSGERVAYGAFYTFPKDGLDG